MSKKQPERAKRARERQGLDLRAHYRQSDLPAAANVSVDADRT